MPEHIPRGQKAVADGRKLLERHHPSSINLPESLFLAWPVSIAVEERVAVVRGDQFRRFFPLRGMNVPVGLHLPKLSHRLCEAVHLVTTLLTRLILATVEGARCQRHQSSLLSCHMQTIHKIGTYASKERKAAPPKAITKTSRTVILPAPCRRSQGYPEPLPSER